MKKRSSPHYPDIARKAGIEGSVWVKVLVGTDGKVHEVKVLKESGANVGFEESALASALSGEWKPATSDGKPVALWVAYEVKFKLRH